MWRSVHAQATGMSHLRAGLPCQDRLACGELPDGTFLGVIADGAGSAAMGEVGAELAVNVVFERMCLGLQDDQLALTSLLQQAAELARQAVLAEAVQRQLEPRELASTLLALVVHRDGGGA